MIALDESRALLQEAACLTPVPFESEIPLYLLIKPNTSLCQTMEFSGLMVHCAHQ